MYQPKFELLSFASLSVQRKQIVLRAALEFLIVADWNFLIQQEKEHPDQPTRPLYDSAPHYVLKVRPGGLDAWQDIPQTIALGSGDCVAEGSLVKTERGHIPIEHVKIGDRVATRAGWKRVENQGCMALNAETLRLRSDTGSVFRATKDHRVLTNNRGFIPLGELRERDELVEVSSEGSLIQTRVAAIETAPRTNVYDITVADKHEFACYEKNSSVSAGIYGSNCKDFACWRIAELRHAGYDDVYPHIKVSYHQDPSGHDPMMTVYHIQVRIHDIIEDPSAILGMPKNVSYEQLAGKPSAIAAPTDQQLQMAAGMFNSRPAAGPYSPIDSGPFAPQFGYDGYGFAPPFMPPYHHVYQG